MGPTKSLLVVMLLAGCHQKYVPPPDEGADPVDAQPVVVDAGVLDSSAPPDLTTIDLSPPPPDLGPDLRPAPAVPGGTIVTPPVCTAGTEVALTTGDAIDGFTWLWDVDHYVVVYSMDGDMYAGRLNADGTSIAPAQLIEATVPASTQPSMARCAGGYVVAWEEGVAPNKGVRAHQLDPLAVPTGNGVAVAPSAAAEARPSLTHGPTGLALAWIDSELGVTTVRAGLLGSDLSLLGTAQRFGTTTADASYPSLVGDDLSLALIWSDGRAGQYDPRIAMLDPMLGVVSEVPLRTGQPGDGLLPRSIRTTFGYLTAWEDSRTGDNEIHMALTDTQGGLIADGTVEEPDTGDANWPNLAWSGVGAAAVYYQFRGAPQIYLSYIDATGKRIGGGADVQVSHAPAGRARFPDVKWTGNDFGVAWIDTRSQTGQLYFNRVTCK